MTQKRFLAALALLAMLFSLGGCSFFTDGASGSAKPKYQLDDSKVEQDDYTLAVDALQLFLDDSSDASYARLTGGSLASKEVSAFISAFEAFYGQEADSFCSALREDVGGGSIQSHEDFPVDENTRNRSQSELERFCSSLQASIDATHNEVDSMTETAWKANADQRGISVQELKQDTQDMLDAMESLLAALQGVQIDRLHTARIALSGANTSTRDVTIFFADGKWFTADLFDFPV